MSSFSKGLSARFVEQYAEKPVPWGPVGYVTYKRTYARLIPEEGCTEEWYLTCARAVNGLVEIGGRFTERELEQLYDTLFNLRACVSGRALWQLGTPTVRRVGADSLCNCWHVLVNHPEAFCFTFNQLMLGGGVGFNVLPEHVYELPVVKYDVTVKRVETPDCDFVVPDNREGWVELMRRVFEAVFFTGKSFTYSTQCIRHRGTPIKSFGGVASGPEDLVAGIELILKILRSRLHQKLRPIDCVDIQNIIGMIVVAGNVRRSSEIAIGSAHDRLFLDAKNWNKITVPNWRSNSNNSVACDSIEELLPEFWEGYKGNGEPLGLINLRNCRRFARLVDGESYRPDWSVCGVNPCGEANLANKEPCNLAEIFLPNIRSEEEFRDVAVLLYKACKTISNAHYSDPNTEAIVHEHHKIGLGLTGWMAAPQFRDAQILDGVYRTLEEADRVYSKMLGCGLSNRLTTMKPSGTLSLLPAGVTPGMHCALARWMIRRIRFASNDPLVEIARKHGYHIEPKLELDGSYDPNTMVVEFPVDMGPNVVTEDQVNVLDELEMQKFLQTYWADQSISCTHYFKKGELPDIKKWLDENYDASVKTASFLLSSGHGFKQAPFEKITEAEYQEIASQVTPITRMTDDRERDHVDYLECPGGACPVK